MNKPGGYWHGSIVHQHVPLEIGLHIQGSDTGLLVSLDIPRLIYAWQPVSAWIVPTGLSVEFPFGIGRVDLEVEGDSLIGANGAFQVHLARANTPSFTHEEVNWSNGDVILQGSLYRPGKTGTDKVPLIIMTHGSGIGHRGRWEYSSYADLYLRHGLAVLLYDRRGSGASNGDHRKSTLSDLSADLLAGIDHIKTILWIDTARIGISGGSQAAVIAFMATAASSSIDLLVLSGAPAVPLDVQDIHNVIHYMRKEQEPAGQIDSALAYMRLYHHYVATGRLWIELEKQARRAEVAQWGAYVDQPLEQHDLDWWRANHNIYRPYKVLPRINVPVLLFYGSEDHVVPPQENTSLMQHYFRSAGNEDLQIKILEGAGHNLELPGGTTRDGSFQWPQKHPAFFTELEQWLVDHGSK